MSSSVESPAVWSRRKDGVNHYHFSYRGRAAKAPESGSVWVGDYAPILYVSTYPDMIAVGKAYADAAAPMAQDHRPHPSACQRSDARGLRMTQPR